MDKKQTFQRIEKALYKPTCALLGFTLLTGVAAATEEHQTTEPPIKVTYEPKILPLRTPTTNELDMPSEAPTELPATTTTTSTSIPVVPAPAEEAIPVVTKQSIPEVTTTTLPPQTTLPPAEALPQAAADCPAAYSAVSESVCYAAQDNYHVVRVDLSNPKISVCPAYVEQPGSLGSLNEAAKRYGAVAAINASFFYKSGRTLGPLACNGRWIGQDPYPEIVFGYHTDGSISTKPTEQALREDVSSLRFAVSGSHVLVSEGQVVQDYGEDNKDGVLYKRHHRTAIGIDDKDFLYMAVTETDNKVTMPELAQYMGRLGTRMAINLDGGGSSQMEVQYTNVAHRGSTERNISTGLFVVTNP